MKISGVATVHAPPARVWTALTDPAVLLATVPGCERLDPAGPGSYRFAVRANLASIEGSYAGEVSVAQRQEASSLVLTVKGAGARGAVTMRVQVRLAEAAGYSTELSYDADAEVGGLIAGVGQRMLSSIARRIADEFVSSVDDVLTGSARAGTGVVSPADDLLAGSARAGTGVVSPAAAPGPAAPLPAAPVPAAPVPDTQLPAALVRVPDTRVPAAFARGVVVGAAGALAGVALAGLIGRRGRLMRADELLADAATSFPYGSTNAD
jgi:carbon monoxide dehydrogenase subunit G